MACAPRALRQLRQVEWQRSCRDLLTAPGVAPPPQADREPNRRWPLARTNHTTSSPPRSIRHSTRQSPQLASDPLPCVTRPLAQGPRLRRPANQGASPAPNAAGPNAIPPQAALFVSRRSVSQRARELLAFPAFSQRTPAREAQASCHATPYFQCPDPGMIWEGMQLNGAEKRGIPTQCSHQASPATPRSYPSPNRPCLSYG